MCLHYLGKREPRKLHLFTKTLHIALQTNTKPSQIITCLSVNHPSLLVRQFNNSVNACSRWCLTCCGCLLVGYFLFSNVVHNVPSVLWRCWLGGRKGIRPVKNWVVGAGVVICLEQGADLHMAQLMPLPLTVSCFSKIQIGFTFLVPAHLGSPGKRAVKRVCVCIA